MDPMERLHGPCPWGWHGTGQAKVGRGSHLWVFPGVQRGREPPWGWDWVWVQVAGGCLAWLPALWGTGGAAPHPPRAHSPPALTLCSPHPNDI